MEISYRLYVSKIKQSQCIIFKIRNLVNGSILRTIYFTISESNLNYCSLAWSQNCNAINHLVILQKKPLRIINLSHVILTRVLYSKKGLFLNS